MANVGCVFTQYPLANGVTSSLFFQVLVYLLRLADVCGVDLPSAAGRSYSEPRSYRCAAGLISERLDVTASPTY
eukprot:1488574-Pyramimonas_sp.AAC.1